MATDVLVRRGDRASAAMVLTNFGNSTKRVLCILKWWVLIIQLGHYIFVTMAHIFIITDFSSSPWCGYFGWLYYIRAQILFN